MIPVYLKYYFRKAYFFRFTPFVIPAIYYHNIKIALLLYMLLFILYENCFCKPFNEKYLWDNRMNIITEVNTGKLFTTVNLINLLSIAFWFYLSLVINYILNHNIADIGYLIIQFLSLLLFSTIIGNFLYFIFSKIPPFFAKRIVRILIFSIPLNISVAINFLQFYFQIIFLTVLIFVWYKQIKYFNSHSHNTIKI